MVAIGLVFVQRRLPGGRVLAGLLLGFAGVGLLALSGASDLGAVGLIGVVLSLAGSLAWAGLFNTFYWIDPARDRCAAIMMQFLPFVDHAAVGMLKEFEQAVYS